MKIVVMLLVAASAFAQTKPIVLKAAHMFDGVSDRVVSPGLIVILGDKIRGVGANAEIPAGAEIIDLGNATLLPGFIDAHTHLTMDFDLDYSHQELVGLKKTIPEKKFLKNAWGS